MRMFSVLLQVLICWRKMSILENSGRWEDPPGIMAQSGMLIEYHITTPGSTKGVKEDFCLATGHQIALSGKNLMLLLQSFCIKEKEDLAASNSDLMRDLCTRNLWSLRHFKTRHATAKLQFSDRREHLISSPVVA